MTDKAPKKTDLMSEAERDAYHAEKMRKKKEARNKILATKTEERGLLIVHTGKGKGKSTAAFGMVFRAIGHGFKVGVVQFVKGAFEIIATLDYMFAFAATTGAVKTHHFDLAFEAFVEDDATREFIRQNNRFGYDELIAKFNEARRRGFWVPRSNSAFAFLEEDK